VPCDSTDATSFGFHAPSPPNPNDTTAPPAATVAPGYYETKWFVNAVAIMDAYAWPGNKVLRFVRVDQL